MNTKIFLDTVSLQDVEKYKWLISGVTTTPTFFVREGVNYNNFISNFREIYPYLELHIEALGIDSESTIKEIEKIINSDWFDSTKVVLKIPISFDNLKIVKHYSEKEIRFNTHLVFTPNQATLAALVNSSYVCPLIGRYADNFSQYFGKNMHGGDSDLSRTLINEIKEVLLIIRADKTKIMGSSIRTAGDFYNAAIAGADVITAPPKVIDELFNHPMTSDGINIFLKDMRLI